MAYELKQAAELSQRIELTGRERLTVTGVEDVERFDDRYRRHQRDDPK